MTSSCKWIIALVCAIDHVFRYAVADEKGLATDWAANMFALE